MTPDRIPVVILCGGQGTRFHEETQYRPKPLIEIGSEPILLHIMRHYSSFGFRRFILCLGYRGIMIKEFFLNHEMRVGDMKFDLNTGARSYLGGANQPDWEILFAETGEKSQTGARIARIARYIDTPHFMLTYGDGVSDIDLGKLLSFHLAHGAIGTVTAVAVSSPFGELVIDRDRVSSFAEKPKIRSLINGGFFAFDRRFFDYVSDDPDCILEREPVERLTRDDQLRAYVHDGFWRCMDTFKDYQSLNEIYLSGDAPWVRARGTAA